jgi:hypothetical protein
MSKFTINLTPGGGVRVIDHATLEHYDFTNDQKSMGTGIYAMSHHDKNGRPLNINDQAEWVKNNSLTFTVPDAFVKEVRDDLNSGFKGGSRRRSRRRGVRKSLRKSSRKRSYKRSCKRS